MAATLFVGSGGLFSYGATDMRDPKLVEAIRLGGTVRLGDGRLVSKAEDLPDDYISDATTDVAVAGSENPRGDAQKIDMLTNDLENAQKANQALLDRICAYEELFVKSAIVSLDELTDDHDANFILIQDLFLDGEEIENSSEATETEAVRPELEVELPSGEKFQRFPDGAMLVVDTEGKPQGIARVNASTLKAIATALQLPSEGTKAELIEALKGFQL